MGQHLHRPPPRSRRRRSAHLQRPDHPNRHQQLPAHQHTSQERSRQHLTDPRVGPNQASTVGLAKLTWSIRYGALPDWAERIGRSTLVIIDEAGMADTLSLDTAVTFLIGRREGGGGG